MARLTSNFCRRRMPPEEMTQRVSFLVGKAGLTAEAIARITGIHVSTVLRYLPQEFKNKQNVEAGKASGVVRTSERSLGKRLTNSEAPFEDTKQKDVMTTSENPMSVKLVKMIDLEAQGRSCPVCGITISSDKFDFLKKKFKQYPDLFPNEKGTACESEKKLRR